MSPGLRSAAIFRRYGLFIGPRQMPDRSGLPSAVRGAGADRFALPAGVRGMPEVLIVSHCAAKEADSKNAKVVTAAVAGNSLAFILSLLFRDYIASFRVAVHQHGQSGIRGAACPPAFNGVSSTLILNSEIESWMTS